VILTEIYVPTKNGYVKRPAHKGTNGARSAALS